MRAVEISKEVVLFVTLVLLQVIVLSRITLFGFATPLLYIYFIIKLPFGRNRFYVIISSFILGLVIDIFLNTPGVNAAASTIVASLRVLVAPLFYPKNELEVIVPSIRTSASAFIKYTIVMVAFHHTLLFFIDALSLFNFTEMLIRIGSSSLVTILLILSMDSLFYRKGRVVG